MRAALVCFLGLVPPGPYVFNFSGLIAGDITLPVVSFDLSEETCSVSKMCTFSVAAP